jgi:hypothetical protein
MCDRNTVGVIPSEERDLLVTVSFVGADKAVSSSGNGKNALCRNDDLGTPEVVS